MNITDNNLIFDFIFKFFTLTLEILLPNYTEEEWYQHGIYYKDTCHNKDLSYADKGSP